MKKCTLFIFFILFFTKIVTCQTKNIYLIGGGGLSHHGTGDMPGYSFFNQVDIQIGKRFFLSPGIQFTNNSVVYEMSGDFHLNYVTAGMNIFTDINYLLLNKSHHRIAIGSGPLLRFENSSVPREVGTNLGPAGDQVLFISYDKLHSTSFGYNITPSYYYQCSNKLVLGTKFIFQNDTRGDVLTAAVLFVGVKL